MTVAKRPAAANWTAPAQTLSELTDLLQKAGAVDALNLSGEGSSHLFVAGGLANTPSDRRGRPGVVFERMLPSIGIVN